MVPIRPEASAAASAPGATAPSVAGRCSRCPGKQGDRAADCPRGAHCPRAQVGHPAIMPAKPAKSCPSGHAQQKKPDVAENGDCCRHGLRSPQGGAGRPPADRGLLYRRCRREMGSARREQNKEAPEPVLRGLLDPLSWSAGKEGTDRIKIQRCDAYRPVSMSNCSRTRAMAAKASLTLSSTSRHASPLPWARAFAFSANCRNSSAS